MTLPRGILPFGALAALAIAASSVAFAACKDSPTLDLSPLANPLTSVVTVRFVRDGQPVTVDVLSQGYRSDDENCGSDVFKYEDVTQMAIEWPPAGWPTTCLRVGANVEFGFRLTEGAASDSQDAVARFVWTGEDMAVDLEIDR